jgi:hypothetical protein
MALELKAQLATDSTGRYLWTTDTTGEYDAVDNPGGHGDGGDGSGNSNLNEVAMMVIGKVNNETPIYHDFIGTQVRYNASYTNDQQLQWQLNYKQDGWHTIYLIKLWASSNDVNSLDSYNARTFIIDDMWYNVNESVVKVMESGGARTLDLTNAVDLELIIANENNVKATCQTMYYVDLFKKKEEFALIKRESRRNEDYQQENEARRNQTEILLQVASADWNYGGGNMYEAHDIVETLIDDFL